MIKLIIGKDPNDIKMFVDRVQVPVPQLLLSKLSFTIEAPDKRRLVLESESFEIEAEVEGNLAPIGDAPYDRAMALLNGDLAGFDGRNAIGEMLLPDMKFKTNVDYGPVYELRCRGENDRWWLSVGAALIPVYGRIPRYPDAPLGGAVHPIFGQGVYKVALRAAINVLKDAVIYGGQKCELRTYNSRELNEVYYLTPDTIYSLINDTGD